MAAIRESKKRDISFWRLTLAERLRQARKERGVKQAVLAERIGVTASTVSAYERGACMPSDYTITKIARSLNVNPMWLVGKSENMEFSAE